MQDFLLAGLILVFFIVFLMKTQSFASTLSPSPSLRKTSAQPGENLMTPPPGSDCFTNIKGLVLFPDDISGAQTNLQLCGVQASEFSGHAYTTGDGRHYCCK
jgi:hypothetical protein